MHFVKCRVSLCTLVYGETCSTAVCANACVWRDMQRCCQCQRLCMVGHAALLSVPSLCMVGHAALLSVPTLVYGETCSTAVSANACVWRDMQRCCQCQRLCVVGHAALLSVPINKCNER
jgi:hypothetical protein